MKKTMVALALGFASAGSLVQAQTDTTGITALNDRIDDIQTAVNDEIARGNDENRFGNPEFNSGLSGSASLHQLLITETSCERTGAGHLPPFVWARFFSDQSGVSTSVPTAFSPATVQVPCRVPSGCTR